MVKSLHRSLEAKLASIKDPVYSESENEDDDQPETGISVKRTDKGTKRKGKMQPATDEEANQPSTVIYLGHLPVGFEEREITVFLNQFGSVKRCKVSRSTKTGRSRGYAFVDFIDPEVSEIVAETMSGYFLLEKRLVCHVLPNDKVHEHMFSRPKKIPSKADKQKKAREEVNKFRPAEAMKGITAKLVKREEMKRKKLASLGINYDFPGYAASAQPTDGSLKKKRKVSDDGDDADVTTTENNINETKTPKSKKKKKKSKNIVEEEKENEENETVNDTNESPETEVKSSKKKKKSKKGQTPKKTL